MKPTKEQLANCSKKKGGFIELYISRRLSLFLVKYIARTNITPNQITYFAFLVAIVSSYLISTGKLLNLIIGGILVQVAWTLDCVDGDLARLKGISSKKGAWADAVLDRLTETILLFGITLGLYNQTNNAIVWLYGFIALASVYMTNSIIGLTESSFDKSELGSSHKKLFLVRILEKIGIKPQFLSLGIDVEMFIIFLGVITNQLFITLLFFMIVYNLYWIVMFFMIFKRN